MRNCHIEHIVHRLCPPDSLLNKIIIAFFDIIRIPIVGKVQTFQERPSLRFLINAQQIAGSIIIAYDFIPISLILHMKGIECRQFVLCKPLFCIGDCICLLCQHLQGKRHIIFRCDCFCQIIFLTRIFHQNFGRFQILRRKFFLPGSRFRHFRLSFGSLFRFHRNIFGNILRFSQRISRFLLSDDLHGTVRGSPFCSTTFFFILFRFTCTGCQKTAYS